MGKTYQKLTRLNLRKVPANTQVTEHGITFERLPSGDGVFSINVMVDGQRIHRVIGRESDGVTRTQAEECIEQIRSDARHDRLALPRGRKLTLSFRDAATQYLERLRAGDGKDVKMKRSRLQLHLVPFFGDTPLSKIGSFDIERYKHDRLQEASLRGGDRVSAKARAQGAAPSRKAGKATASTVNRELAVLSHLFNMAIEWGWIAARPVKIKRLKEDAGRIFYLTVEQAQRLIEAAKDSDNRHVYPFVVVGLETGMRAGEILSIRREHVDTDRRIIHIPKAKAGQREQPITAHLAEFLKGYIEALPRKEAWLFPSLTSKSGHAVDIRAPFRKAVEAAGLDPNQVVRHTLRHTTITHLVQAGVDLPTVKRISGHKTLAMVERYAHQSGEHISAAMDALQERMRPA